MECPSCKNDASQGDAFCPKCGAALAQGQHQPPPPPPPPPPGGQGERRSLPQDLAAYVGFKAEFYMPSFQKFHETEDRFAATWNWPAFFFSFWWLLYRKMYLWAGVCFALVMLASFGGLLFMIACGLLGNWLYYRHAKGQIIEAQRMYKPGEISQAIAQRGGVHGWVPWVAAVVTVLMIGFFVVFGSLIFMLSTGEYGQY